MDGVLWPWDPVERVASKPAVRTSEERAEALKVARLQRAFVVETERVLALGVVQGKERHWHNVVNLARASGASWAEVGQTCGLGANAARMRFERLGLGPVVDPSWAGRNPFPGEEIDGVD